MAFGVYPYSAAPPQARRGGGGIHKGRPSVWAAFIVLMVCFYAGVVSLYLFAHPRPSPNPALRLQQHQSETPRTAALVHNPPGSVDGVVVLGMHRSGTSMITGLLQRMGLHLGPPHTLLGAVEGENDKGFFERMQVIGQNDRLMAAQDVNWALHVFNFDHLEAIRAALSDKQGLFAEGMAALAYYNDPTHAPWAVKDPRLCITLKFWMAFWKTPPAVLFVYRHPIEVAKSLVRRKEFGPTRGMHLWVAYNRLAIENSRGLCRVVTSDAALIHEGHTEVLRIHDQLKACGMAIPRAPTLEDVQSFVDSGLRHQKQALDAAECDPASPKLWRSEEKDPHEKERQEIAYEHARRLYCAMRDGSAFWPGFEFEDLSDAPPP